MAPLHVLHVARPITGGVPRVVERLPTRSSAVGECRSPAPARATSARRPWPRAPSIARRRRRAPGPATAGETRRLAQIVRRTAPDVVHLHSSKAGLPGALRSAAGCRQSSSRTAGCLSWPAGGRAAATGEPLAARWGHALVCLSEGERAVGEAVGIRGRWRIIPNGVDLERFRPAGEGERRAARRALGLDPDARC